MTQRQQIVERIAAAQTARGLTYSEIAQAISRHPVWTAAALMGQASMSVDEAQRVCQLLSLEDDVARALAACPMKGALDQTVPVDPLIYRFYEIMQVYGPALKAIIHEEFGDGIMSAIDFEMDVRRQPDPKGDRVVVTMNGKFLPYRKW